MVWELIAKTGLSSTIMKNSSERASTGVRAGRPKSEEKRAAILSAASDLFLERGLKATSMDAVAARAEVSKQTVYSHFRNKDDLFRRCIQNKVASCGLAGDEAVDDPDLRTALRNRARRFVELVFDPEVVAMFRVVVGEAAAHPRISRLFYESGPAATIANLSAFLERQVELGRLRIDDPIDAATQFMVLAKGELHMRLMMNLAPAVDAERLEQHVRRVVDQFLLLYGLPTEGTPG